MGLFRYFRLLLVVLLLLLLRLSVLSAATSPLNDMPARAPATVTVATGEQGVRYATIQGSSITYSRPTEWVEILDNSPNAEDGDVHVALSEPPTRCDFLLP